MKRFLIWVIVVFLVAMSACTASDGNLLNDKSETSTNIPTVVDATNTPEPEQTPLIIFYSDPEADENINSLIDTTLQNLIVDNSFDLEYRSDISNLGSTENLFALVALSNMDSNELINGVPSDIKIILIGPSNGDNPNSQQVRIGINEKEQATEGFVAGYIAAMQTEEWRIGILNFTSQKSTQLGFINGAKYFCGLCSPLYPPYENYPLYAEVNDGAEFEELKIAADLLLQKEVDTIYLAPGINNQQLVSYLSQSGIRMIGNDNSNDIDNGLWIASVGWDWDSVIREVLPEGIMGNFFGFATPDILLEDVSEISPSRLELVAELIQYLNEGIVDPIGQ